MATKLYLHRTEVSTPATLPTGEQSTLTPDANLFDNEDGTENRLMDTTKSGVAQTSLTNTSTADTNAHNYYVARWVSNTIYDAKIDANTWTVEYAASESNTNANFPRSSTGVMYVNCYVWKPSDGTKVGTILDGNSAADGEEAGTTQTVISFTFTGAAVTGITPGDAVIVFEIWAQVTQGTATARTQTVFIDGTTENSTTNEAAFISTPQDVSFSRSNDNMTLVGGGSGVAVATTANTTQYYTLAGILESITTTEAEVQMPIRTAGTFSRLGIRITANAIAGTTTFRSRKNTANGGQSVSIGASATGWFEDLTGTDTVSAGDKMNYQSVPGAATNTMSISLTGTYFSATTSTITVTILSTSQATATTLNNATRYIVLNGYNGNSGTETDGKIRQGASLTFKNLAVYVSANARTSSTTFKSRKNAADGNLSVSVGSTTTGLFEDTSNSDSIVSGDDYNYAFTTGAGSSESLTYTLIKSEAISTVNSSQAVSGNAGGNTILVNVTQYCPVGGIPRASDTESITQRRIRSTDFKVTAMHVVITNNTITATSTVTLRRNAAVGNNTVSIGSSANGTFSDTSHTDKCGSNDDLNWRVVTGATGTSLVIRSIVAVYSPILPFLAGIATETVTVGESLARVVGVSRAPSTETVTSGESLTRLGVFNRPLSTETTTISESPALARSVGRNRALGTETTTIGESLIRKLDAIRAASDTTVIGESLTRMLAANRALNDTVVVGESLTRLITFVRGLATETVTVGESLTRMLTANRALGTETVVVGDSLARIRGINRALATETVVIGETLTRMLAASRSLPETTSISDQLNRMIAANRSLATETVTVGESLTRLLAANRALATQTTTIGESLTYVYTPGGGGPTNYERALSDTVVIGESIARMLAANRALATEVTAISENLARSRGVNRSLATETVTIGESLTRLLAAIRALPESTSVGESLARLLAATRTLSDTTTIGESLTKLIGRVRTLVENTSIGESLNRVFTGTRTLVETTPITDSLEYLKTLFVIPTQLKSIIQWLRSKYSISTPPKDPSY